MATVFTLARRLNHLYPCRDHDRRCNVSRHMCSTFFCSTNFGSLQWYVKQIGSALTFICCHLLCCRIKCYLAENKSVSKWDGGQIQTTKTKQGTSGQLAQYIVFEWISRAILVISQYNYKYDSVTLSNTLRYKNILFAACLCMIYQCRPQLGSWESL